MFVLWLALGAQAEASFRIAVMEFTNAADDDELDALGKGLQSMLTTDLSGLQSVELVERTKLKEIQDELKLSESKWVDPATASKVGKLAGASHLLGGTFTVVGDTMRLDARVFEVKTGKILLAEQQQGERDAFFELEKELVKKLILALKVELTPKERASVRRIHTADFDAFQAFSTGLDHFDEKRYDEAMASLSGAVSADEDFKLARITLEEYGEIITKIRARADSLDADKANRARLAEMATDREDTQIVMKLIDFASTDGRAAQRNRVAALHLLVLMYDSELRYQDRFVRNRARDAYMARYFAEAEPLFPAVPLRPRATSSFGPDNVSIISFEKDFARYTRMVWEGVPGTPEQYWPKTRMSHIRRNISDSLAIGYMAQWLHLDRRQRVALYDQVDTWLAATGDNVDIQDRQDRKRMRSQASRLTKLGEFDKSTLLLKKLADTSSEGSEARRIAAEIEKNAELKGQLNGLSGPKLEYAYLGLDASGSWLKQRLASWDTEGLQHLNNKRELDGCSIDTNNHGPTIIDGHAVWTMQQDDHLYTGARVDPKRGTGIRYFRRPPYREGQTVGADAMLLIDGIPRDSVRISFQTTAKRPDDFVTSNSHLSTAAAVLDVLIGWHDIRTPEVKDSVTREVVEQRKPAGFVVRIRPDRVELIERTAAPDTSREIDVWIEEVHQSAKLGKGKTRKVEVQIQGESVTVTIDGNKQRWTEPGLQRGFYGFGFGGEGFAAIDGLAIAQP